MYVCICNVPTCIKQISRNLKVCIALFKNNRNLDVRDLDLTNIYKAASIVLSLRHRSSIKVTIFWLKYAIISCFTEYVQIILTFWYFCICILKSYQSNISKNFSIPSSTSICQYTICFTNKTISGEKIYIPITYGNTYICR